MVVLAEVEPLRAISILILKPVVKSGSQMGPSVVPFLGDFLQSES